MTAEDDFVERLAAREPAVVDLAALASVAARIEPELLRRLRLDFTASPVSVEVDLWFSDLVSARSAEAMVLDAPLLPALRKRVRPAQVERVAAAIADVHREAPPLLQLEERLVAQLLLGRPAAEIEAHLRAVLGSIAGDPSRRRGLVAWAWKCLPRLPLGDRPPPAAGTLAATAGLAMGAPVALRTPSSRGALAAVPPDLIGTGTVELEARRSGRHLVLAGAHADTPPHRRFPVPATTPRFVEVEAGGAVQLVAVPADGRPVSVPVAGDDVVLRVLGGATWRIVGRAPAPSAPTVTPIATVIIACDPYGIEGAIDAADLILLASAARPEPPHEVPVLEVPAPRVAQFPLISEGESVVEADPDVLADAVLARQGRSFEDVQEAFSLWTWPNDSRFAELEVLPMPGCARATLRVGSRSQTVGILALNPWYLSPALVGDELPDVDVRLLPEDIDHWCARHDVTILLLGAAPERFRPNRLVHLRHAVARRGRFDLVVGAGDRPRPRDHWGGRGHFEISLNPGDRYLLVELNDEGGHLYMQVRPRRSAADGPVDDDSYGPLGADDNSVHMLTNYRSRPPPPPSARAAEILERLRDRENIIVAGRQDDVEDVELEELREVLREHVERGGIAVVSAGELAALGSLEAARLPPAICFADPGDRFRRDLPTCTFTPSMPRPALEELARERSAASIFVLDERGATPQPAAPPSPQPTSTAELVPADSYALLIGIGKYHGDLPPLSTPARDAAELAALLLHPARGGYPAPQVRLLTDLEATRSAILDALFDITGRLTPDSHLLIYFAGHALRSRDEAVLVPVDDEPPRRSIGIADLARWLGESRGRRFTVILDCEWGEDFRTVRELVRPLELVRGLNSLTSARDWSVARRPYDDVVTRALVKGLAGGARGPDQLVRVHDLFRYVQDELVALRSDWRTSVATGPSDNYPLVRCPDAPAPAPPPVVPPPRLGRPLALRTSGSGVFHLFAGSVQTALDHVDFQRALVVVPTSQEVDLTGTTTKSVFDFLGIDAKSIVPTPGLIDSRVCATLTSLQYRGKELRLVASTVFNREGKLFAEDQWRSAQAIAAEAARQECDTALVPPIGTGFYGWPATSAQRAWIFGALQWATRNPTAKAPRLVLCQPAIRPHADLEAYLAGWERERLPYLEREYVRFTVSHGEQRREVRVVHDTTLKSIVRAEFPGLGARPDLVIAPPAVVQLEGRAESSPYPLNVPLNKTIFADGDELVVLAP